LDEYYPKLSDNISTEMEFHKGLFAQFDRWRDVVPNTHTKLVRSYFCRTTSCVRSDKFTNICRIVLMPHKVDTCSVLPPLLCLKMIFSSVSFIRPVIWWGQFYDHFLRFFRCGQKMASLLNNQCWLFEISWVKNANIITKFFVKNIFKIITRAQSNLIKS
jgi:hypothetical protein